MHEQRLCNEVLLLKNYLDTGYLSSGNLTKLRCREEASKAVPGERGKAGAALSYAAITADSSASLQLPQQLLPEQLTEAGSCQPEPAAQTSAEEASPPNAGEGEDAAAAVVADPSASEIKVISSQSSLVKGRNKQNKSGLKQPLVWLDLEMTGDISLTFALQLQPILCSLVEKCVTGARLAGSSDRAGVVVQMQGLIWKLTPS